MKTKNRLKLLPSEDQQRIIELCAQLPYEEVVDLIAKPRAEGGLQIQTSVSALCRYNTTFNPQARRTIVLRQGASSLQVQRQSARGAFPTAILTLLETRIFEALSTGAPISEIKDDLAALKDFHRGFLAEEKWRHSENAKPEAEASLHRTVTGSPSHYDFIPLDEQGQPTEPPPLSPEQLSAVQQLEEGDEITEKDLEKLDETIALDGDDAITLLDYPRELIDQRVRRYRKMLKTRGITAHQAALEIHNRKHGFAPDGTRLPPGGPVSEPGTAAPTPKTPAARATTPASQPEPSAPAPNVLPFQSTPEDSTDDVGKYEK